jgi:tetrahydrodipicolinate N-succinyltransferase
VNGSDVAVAVLVACSVGVELVVGVQVADGVIVGCGVSVTRATRPSREGPRIRTRAVRQAQTANTARAARPPPAASNRRAGQRV